MNATELANRLETVADLKDAQHTIDPIDGTIVDWGPMTGVGGLYGVGVIIRVITANYPCRHLGFIQVKKTKTIFLDALGMPIEDPQYKKDPSDLYEPTTPQVDGATEPGENPQHRLSGFVLGADSRIAKAGEWVVNVDFPGIREGYHGTPGKFAGTGVAEIITRDFIAIWLVCLEPFNPIRRWKFEVRTTRQVDTGTGTVTGKTGLVPLTPSSGPPLGFPSSNVAENLALMTDLGELAIALRDGGYFR